MTLSAMEQLRSIRGAATSTPLERLQSMRDCLQLLHLYQSRWPKEFRASKADLFRFGSDGGGLYSDREMEFLHKLGHLLPINVDYMLEWEERAGAIPIYAVAYDDERCLTAGEALLVSLGNRTLSHEYDERELAEPLRLLPTETVDEHAFTQRCRTIDPVLSRITVALDVGGNCAGNFWTDTTDLFLAECGCYPDWDNATIDQYVAELKAAEPLFAAFETIAGWLTARRSRRRALAKAWNLSQVPAKENPHVHST